MARRSLSAPRFTAFLRDVFYPNPGGWTYRDPFVAGILVVFCLLMLLSFAIRFWRSRLQNPVTKRLSRSWASASFLFGLAGFVLVICRVEKIQFLAMRFLWVLWVASLLLYLSFQFRQFRASHYEIIPQQLPEDPREKYLPKRKKR